MKHDCTIIESPAHARSTSVDLTFFVPCYNEAENIDATLATIAAAVRDADFSYEVLVCDDASTDGTKDRVLAAMHTAPYLPLRLIANTVNRGLGFNYVRGAFLARGTHYMLINGDNVEPEEAIRAIVAQCGTADMVIPHFGRSDRRSAFRRGLSRAFSWIVNRLSGHVIAYYNGPVLHRTENVRFWRAETVGYGYQAEMICRLLHEGMTYVQVQVPNSDRQWGFSKAFAPSNFLSVGNSLFHILWRRLEYSAFRMLTPGVTRIEHHRRDLHDV